MAQKLLDLNKYRRMYRFIRRKPSIQAATVEFVGDADVLIETGEITFTATDQGSHTFTKTFTSAPFVTATAYDSESNDEANVNVYVVSVTTSAVTIGVSASFTGKVHFQAMLPTS